MANVRSTTTAGLLVAATAGFGILAAHADVRVWTDREEVILKGNLQGIEVLSEPSTNGAGSTVLQLPPPDETAAPLRHVAVANVQALYDAAAGAKAGDRITLAPGTYVIDRNSVALDSAGSPEHPIVLTTEKRGSVVIEMTGANGFFVRQPYWTIENLDIVGVCAEDETCEHAFHVVGAANRTIIRNNRIVDFNAPIKGNGRKIGDTLTFPDFVLIENNDIYNTELRDTDSPVTGIDVVGGHGWTVRGNYIADIGKTRGNATTYAAFLKGGSSGGTFERNLVICRRAFGGGQRVGLSFGGGGTNLKQYCTGGDCTSEHRGGTMRNNIVMSCNDVGIYLNRAAQSRIFNNMLYDTRGIDLRYAETSADIRNNILSGAIRLRDSAAGTRRNNVIVATSIQFTSWFSDPDRANFELVNRSYFIDKGEDVPDLTDDFCGNKRIGDAPDIGALEFSQARTCDVAGRMELAD